MENNTPNFDLGKLDVAKRTFASSLIGVSLGLLPGGAFITAGFDHYGKVKQERLNLFFEKFKEYLKSCSQDELDEEFLKSEDFQGLFELIIKKVAQTRSENKRETFKKILINSIVAKKVSDFSETFLELTSQLHDKQIEILNVYKNTIVEYNRMSKEIYEFNNKHEDNINRNSVQVAIGISHDVRHIIEKRNSMLEKRKEFISRINQHSHFKIGKFEFDFYLQDLASKCLMKDIEGSGMGDVDSLNYNVTLLGEHYLDFLKA